ncbi:putative peptidase S49, ClpP/crotonase-like domain-containing protein [Medicago truncatula]|uniref:Putative peptidase S49, ClpP/crotonase-like domain-containing protein n=1 Tax=Medicago truncatula TaxID=3880 RepID=A0A396HX59_MEDTR|nr:putative peptidase S49, ClpP/crotonase-like domain-containing protein [Medicago truncatula]
MSLQFNQKNITFACACDEIFAPPNGHVEFSIDDLSFDRGYDNGLYDNPYINFYRYAEDSSEARDSSEAHTALLHNIYSNWLDKVSSSRGKKREEVQNFINEGVYRLDKLKEEGFISSLVYDDDVITLLKETWEAKEQIAIIRASGTMDSDIVTSNFIEKIGMVKDSKKFKAVIVRIDSVGGDFHASQSTWEAIRSLASKKPVIASMSDAATSAGYYMAMGAGAIVAENLTLTGSIRGTVSQNFNLDNELPSFIPYDDAKVLDNVVRLRLMTLGKLDKMKKVAHGRIWTGKDAASHGLVDAGMPVISYGFAGMPPATPTNFARWPFTRMIFNYFVFRFHKR